MYHLYLLGALIVLLNLQLQIVSQVMLSPSGEVSVCPGNQLSFRCSTNFSLLEWDITVFQSGVPHNRQQFVTPISPLHSTLTILSRHFFNIARSSDQNANPLISMLTIVNAVADINATIINCTEIGSSRAESSTSKATINIINPALTYPELPNVGTPTVLEFGKNRVVTSIDWIQSQNYGNNNIAYSITAVPQAIVMFINTTVTSAQVQVSYNTQYAIGITATLCGLSNATTIVTLHYVKCVHPLHLQMIDDSLRAFLENDPALVGTNATFSCLPGLAFSGPTKSICMRNGEWEPDPREADLECIVNCGPPSPPPNGFIFPYSSTINGAVVNFTCRASYLEENITAAVCNKQGKWDPDPAEFCTTASGINQYILIAISVASAAVVIALLLFVIVVCCGCCRRKHKVKRRKKPRPRKPTPPSKDLYYNVMPKLRNSVELSENMQPKRPIAMYDDVIPCSKRDSDLDLVSKPAKVMYDDILSQSEQDLKQSETKPKVMYDEVLPSSEQAPVELKKNTAYHPADLK